MINVTDTIMKDIDLRAQLPQPISLTNSLISSTIIDHDLIASNVTTSVPISSNSIADRNTILNSDLREQSKTHLEFKPDFIPNLHD